MNFQSLILDIIRISKKKTTTLSEIIFTFELLAITFTKGTFRLKIKFKSIRGVTFHLYVMCLDSRLQRKREYTGTNEDF